MAVDDSTCLEMQDMSQKKVKVPRRTIYFASGDTMEEYSTDEDEEVEPVQKDVLPVDTSKLTWGPYVWFHMWRMAASTVSVCDYMGEKLATLLGITTPKYQYAIDEYFRIQKEEEQENRLAEEAERQFEQNRQQGNAAMVQQPEAFVNIKFDTESVHAPDSQNKNCTDVGGMLNQMLQPLTERTDCPKVVRRYGTSLSPLPTDLVALQETDFSLMNSVSGAGARP